jgi:hypothetical protein
MHLHLRFLVIHRFQLLVITKRQTDIQPFKAREIKKFKFKNRKPLQIK